MQGRHHGPRPLLAGVLELMRGQQAQRGAGGGVRWEEENDRMAHILIVEDETVVAELVHDQLVMAGHSIAVAGDGATALRLLETRPVDLVILDWKLPGLDGLEVCRRIRARSMTPILMLTVRAEEVDRVLGLEVGADSYLAKPFSMRELLARVRAAASRRVDVAADAWRGRAEGSSRGAGAWRP